MNMLKERLKKGETVFGTFLTISSPAVAELLANVGFDFIVIDAEHGLMSYETQSAIITALKATATTPIIRVAGNDQIILKRTLDAGTASVMVPMVNTGEEAKNAIRSCLYPPTGVRGVGAGYSSLFGLKLSEYFPIANDEMLKIIQIEHIDAVNNIDEILAVEDIDLLFVGPSDLASSMGLMDQPKHPDIENAINKVVVAAKQKGVPLGKFCFSVKNAQDAVAQGFQLVSVGLDSVFLSMSASSALKTLKQ